MRGFDTNVLVRYVIEDDARQVRLADELMARCQADGEPVFISLLVLCETVWVLGSAYAQAKAEIMQAIEEILSTDLFAIEHEAVARRSLEQWRAGRADFADYVIGNLAAEAGCTDTVTFDRALAGVVGFTVLR